jgi:ankyrin repeat protein
MATADPALAGATSSDCFGATPLIRAVGADDRAMVDLLLDLGAHVDQRSDWWAGSFGVLDSAGDEMAEHLLQRGATLTPHAAARQGKTDRLRAMLELDPSIVHSRGGDGQMPLHFARTIEIARLLLSAGAQIDARDIDHASTAAHWLSGVRPEVAAYLVSNGAVADPFLAVRTGQIDLLEKLLAAEADGVRVRITRERFPVASPAAGHIYLYSIGEGSGLLHAAAGADRPEVIRWLAAHGADTNARGGYDDATPLHTAAWADKPVAVESLLDSGADINAKSGSLHHNEPIGWAIVGGSLDAFRVLLRRGATVGEHHLADARKGAEGAFRALNPRRPAEQRRQIAEALQPA